MDWPDYAVFHDYNPQAFEPVEIDDGWSPACHVYRVSPHSVRVGKRIRLLVSIVDYWEATPDPREPHKMPIPDEARDCPLTFVFEYADGSTESVFLQDHWPNIDPYNQTYNGDLTLDGIVKTGELASITLDFRPDPFLGWGGGSAMRCIVYHIGFEEGGGVREFWTGFKGCREAL